MAQAHTVDDYLETIYFLAFPIGEYRPLSQGEPTLAARVAERLGHPDRCPHGWPVDTEFEQAENRELSPLSDLGPGERATIVRLAEHDGDLLRWFYDQGLVPGQEIEVREAEPAAGQLTVGLDGVERAVGEKAAAGLFVRRAA